jgi:hypothetical protein
LSLGSSAAFVPGPPYAVLVVNGQYGSAKSTTRQIARMLIDPAKVLLTAPPGSERDLAIAAQSARVVAFDNLSQILDWLSVALSRLATGAGLQIVYRPLCAADGCPVAVEVFKPAPAQAGAMSAIPAPWQRKSSSSKSGSSSAGWCWSEIAA